MNEQSPPPDPGSPPAASHKDRRTGLIHFGIFLILLGLLCLGIAALIPIGQSLAPADSTEPMPLRLMIPGLLIFALWIKRFFRSATSA